MKKNDLITLEINDITNLGFGVGRHEGHVVFVSDAVKGDVVSVKIIKVGASFCVGRVEQYLKSSPLREEGRCSISQCKSCAYKAISYAEELKIKEEAVRQIFKKSGLSEVNIAPIVGSPSVAKYRNKAQYPIAMNKNGEYVIGFFAPKSHRVTEAADCALAPNVFGEINETLREFFKAAALSVYDEETSKGLLRHVYLRRGEISGEILLTLVINGDTLPDHEALVSNIKEKFPAVVGILLNVNKENTNVILGDRFVTLYGRDHILDTLAGVELKITAPSFYQVNHDAAEKLYSKAKELCRLSGDELVLDLYCGAGSIGLSMAKECREVIGVEIVESAVECAKYNAKLNGIENASFYSGDASDTAKMLSRAEKARGEKISPDVIILDPPRGGSTPELISYVSRLDPSRIVYISCNPSTLARDIAEFGKYGFTTDEVTPFDLFPATGHVESVVCLTRSDKAT
jgi:23S rRNA (uracil1939-C5)-methyltransferase